MKKILLVILLIAPLLGFSQQSAFAKFEDNNAITAVVVNKKMFELMGNVKMDVKDKEAQQYLALVKKLDNLKVFTSTNGKAINDMKNTVGNYLKSNPLEELMRINDGGRNIKIYVKSNAGSTQVKELLMFIEGAGSSDTVLMSLTGNFDLNEISLLTDKMKLPGGNELKKASKK